MRRTGVRFFDEDVGRDRDFLLFAGMRVPPFVV
jgi:hypothetical protein